jgi:hypothetical protein
MNYAFTKKGIKELNPNYQIKADERKWQDWIWRVLYKYNCFVKLPARQKIARGPPSKFKLEEGI